MVEEVARLALTLSPATAEVIRAHAEAHMNDVGLGGATATFTVTLGSTAVDVTATYPFVVLFPDLLPFVGVPMTARSSTPLF